MVRRIGEYGFNGVLQVKGLPGRVNVKQRPFELRSLNHGDAFIIDTGRKLYQWNGAEANEEERTKATELARDMLETRSMHDENFYVIESGEGDKMEKIVLNLLPKKHRVFFGLFTRNSKIKTAKQGGKDSKQKPAKVQLYKVSINKPYSKLNYRLCKYGRSMRPNPNKRPRPVEHVEHNEHNVNERPPSGRMEEVDIQATGLTPVKQSRPSCYSRSTLLTTGSSCFESESVILSRPSSPSSGNKKLKLYSHNWLYKRDTLVMDTGFGMYLWVGNKSKIKRLSRAKRGIFEKDDNFATEIMKTFSQKYGVSMSIPWHVVHEGAEPEDFKRHFAVAPCEPLVPPVPPRVRPFTTGGASEVVEIPQSC